MSIVGKIDRKNDYPIDAIVRTDFSAIGEALQEYGEVFIYSGDSTETSIKRKYAYAWIIRRPEIRKDLKTQEISKENIEDLLNRKFGKDRYNIEFVRWLPP